MSSVLLAFAWKISFGYTWKNQLLPHLGKRPSGDLVFQYPLFVLS